jgi:Glycine zipper 2TM domain
MKQLRHTLLGAAVGALALLAACSSKEPPPAPTADATAQNEATPTAAPAATPAPAATTAAAPKPATRPAVKPAPPAPQPKPMQVVIVPAGTTLALSLSTPLSSKTAKVGDPVGALLTDDVLVDGKTAIANGTRVAGTVVKVVSGSDKIGGTPTLAVSFDRLELPGGRDVPISGEITQKGKSDNTRDTVKIVGGTAAGAIIGDKVIKGKKGKVIGGLLGGAVGAVAAQKTGTEVELAEGTALAVTLDVPVEITK